MKPAPPVMRMFLGLYPDSAVLLLVVLPLLMVKLDDGWECAVLVFGGWACGMKGVRDQGLGKAVLIGCICRRPTRTTDSNRHPALAGLAMAEKRLGQASALVHRVVRCAGPGPRQEGVVHGNE